MNSTIGAYFKQLQILFFALSGGCLILLLVFYSLSNQSTSTLVAHPEYFEVAGAVVAFGLAIAARFAFFNTCRKGLQDSTLKGKLTIFKTAYIIQMALLEGGLLLNAILYFIGKSNFNLAIAGCMLFLMIMRRPTRPLAAMLLFTPQENNRVIYDDNQVID